MADNIAITAGAGTSVATDDVGGAHYQRVKPCHGADGAATDTSSSNPMPVTLGTADPALVAITDQGYTATSAYTRPSDTTAYTADDALSNSTSAPTAGGLTFTVARASGKSFLITDLFVVASAGTTYQGELFLFDTAPTAINDNAAFTVSDAEMLTCIGKIPFSLAALGANSHGHTTNVCLFATTVSATTLRGLVRITSAATPGNAEVITFRLKGIPVG